MDNLVERGVAALPSDRLGWLLARTLTVALALSPARALDNGLALTPAMGYNPWSAFGCEVDEQKIKDLVNKHVALGLKDAGYTYFNLDDCWASPTRKNGKLQADQDRFPSGMKALGDFIHSKVHRVALSAPIEAAVATLRLVKNVAPGLGSLKFGIYSDAGLFTCAGRAGSMGHEEEDAKQFAEWGVDYLKYDNCGILPGYRVEARNALNATGRPIYFSMCEWGVSQPELWAREVGNSWRTSPDITATWDSIMANLDSVIGLGMHAGPGRWNDPDMLEVGNGGDLIYVQRDKAHFGLWALLKAPLLIGADVRSINQASLDVLLAREVIAINQDSLGVAGDLIYMHGAVQVFAAPLEGGDRAVGVLYRRTSGAPANVTVPWARLGYPEYLPVGVRDLFAEETWDGSVSKELEVLVPSASLVLLRLTPRQGFVCEEGVDPLEAIADELDMLSDAYGEMLCVSTEDLNAWRPWQHGFFGSRGGA